MNSLAKLSLFILLISACGPVTPVGIDAMPTRVPQEYQDFSYQMVWSADDSMIVLSTNTGLYVYDTESYKQLAAFDGLAGATAIFSNKYLTAVTKNKLFVWNLEDFSLLFSKVVEPETYF